MHLLQNVCRVCANTIKDEERARNLFSNVRGKFVMQLRMITGVELCKQQDMPERICERCRSELDLAIKFRERCNFSQKYLLDMLKKERAKERANEEHFFNKIMKQDSEDDAANLDSTEPPELAPLDDEEEFIELDQAQTNARELYVWYEVIDVVDCNETVAAMDSVSTQDPAEQLVQQELKALEQERCLYICEKCGQHFAGQRNYEAHMAKHVGERQNRRKRIHPCDKCAEVFTSGLRLKRHRLAQHSSERRHKCDECGECFAERGAKLRHEKAHANERPYPCLECDMRFDSAALLRAHFLTHGAHTYRCEPCSEDFAHRQDLLAHSRTAPHAHNAQHMQNEMDMLCANEEEGEDAYEA